MRMAIIGSGIAGLASAWLLSRQHEVTLFEAAPRLGGHTHTQHIELGGRSYLIDTGFIVHNPAHYPLLTGLFDELGVPTQPTQMSFSVRNERSGLEYNASTLDSLFCQRRNLLSPRFIGMLRDLLRFYREAPRLLALADGGPSLGEWLGEGGYGSAFRDEHLLPMASALWSSPASEILSFPAKYLIQFMANHQMLQNLGRPQWRVVQGGSSRYIDALSASWKARAHIDCPVLGVNRDEAGVILTLRDGEATRFDAVVLACHSDDALALLADADPRERDILGALHYQDNDTVLHTDTRVLPVQRKAWAAWNASVDVDPNRPCSVSYWMNRLQGVESDEQFIVTLNRTSNIDPDKILRRMHYRHPLYNHVSVAARARKHEIQGQRHTWFAGAYWGWGFHEDGMRSAVEVANALGVEWPGSSR